MSTKKNNRKNCIFGKIISENSGFIVSKLVDGSGEQFWTGPNSFCLDKKFVSQLNCPKHFGQAIQGLS